MQKNKITHWNSYYDNGTDFGFITSQALSKLLSYTNPNVPKVALDIGCGTGQLMRELNHRGYQCLGIDVSGSAVRIAKSLTTRSDELQYLQSDIENVDIETLPLQPYSLITCKLVYAFVQNKGPFLKKVDELLVNGRIQIR